MSTLIGMSDVGDSSTRSGTSALLNLNMFKSSVVLALALVLVAIAGPVARQIDAVTWVDVEAGTTIQWRRDLPTPALQARQIDAVTWVDVEAGTTIQWRRDLPTPAPQARQIDAVTWVDVEAGTTIQWR
ncbi:hypothetical protein B0H14DRAFT_2634045 [Mycena olivaceomarginata]|nr:hypothetical protein B0H14DRAFT_2634045 [Mycena olivaceomarginata]